MGDVAISGGTEEMEMEEGAGMKDWEDQGGRALTWQRFLPRMSLRVLLVEADDSTRQIISALLRKCNYRVAAAADGLKAWEMLKEKSQSIDLVLTEVELPSLSGYSLLNLTMEHDPCRRIPVIMMSSNDSINMVFKCMLKGASDFLVKPIRKNELRNLWQHVWRRHSFNGGPYGTCEHQVENCAQPKSGAHPENNAASSHSSDSIDSLQKKRNCSKKESDTQSSCTRPDMEAESAYMQNAEDQRQSSCINSSVTTYMGHKDDSGCKLDEEHSDKSTLILHVENNNQVVNSSDCTSEKEDPSARVTSQKIMISRGCMDYSKILSENNQTKLGLNKHSIEVDLIGTMDHQMQGEQQPRGCSVVQTDVSKEKGSNDSKDQKVNSPLELSLQRYHHVSSEKQEKDELELNLLNHSHSSAFSRYNNRAVVSQLPMSNVLRDSEGQACTSSVIQPSNDPLRSSTYPCDGSSLNMHLENSHSPGFHPSCQDGAAPCLNPGLLLYPYPVAGPSYDGHCSPHHSVMRPVFYTQQTPPAWSLSSAKQEVPHARLAPWTDQDTLNSGQKNCPGNQNSGKQNFEAEKKQMPNMESLDEKQVSSMTIQSSSVCHGSKNHPSSSGCGSVCNGSNGNLTTVNGSSMDVPGSSTESSNGHGHISYDGTKLVDIQRSIQREAALNKFRLKRKDRCYEKKVRYQSRKRLAEQRPRVKGQFVRQVKLDALASG